MHVFYHSLIIWSSWTKHITLHAATVLVLVIKSVLSHRVCTFSPGLRVSGEPSVAEFAYQFFLYKASRVRPHKVEPNRADHCHSGQDHRVRLHRAFYTKHQGWTRKHQASRAFYTNHQSNKSSKHKIIKASGIRGLLCKASRVDPQADTLCIKASRAFYTIHQSIKSSKHQTSRAFYTKHQGWTRKLTPCAFRFSDLKVNIFRA